MANHLSITLGLVLHLTYCYNNQHNQIIAISKGKNCNGKAIDVQRLPEAPGRKKEIKYAKLLEYWFRPANGNTQFKFSCIGGCIIIKSVSMIKCYKINVLSIHN